MMSLKKAKEGDEDNPIPRKMPFVIRLFELLEQGKLIRFQEAREKGLLLPLNPYAPLLFLSHRWRGEFDCDSDNSVFDAFAIFSMRLVNRNLKSKFLEDSRSLLDTIFPLVHNLQDRTCNKLELCARIGDREKSLVSKFLDLNSLDDFALQQIIGILKSVDVWIDYTCLPQSPRSVEDEKLFRDELNHLADIIACSSVICIWTGDELSRAWCVYEYLVAQLILGENGVGLYSHSDFNLRERQLSSNVQVIRYPRSGGFTCKENLGGGGYAPEYQVQEDKLVALRKSVSDFVNGLRSSENFKQYFLEHSVRCSNGHDVDVVIRLLTSAIERYGDRYGMTGSGIMREDMVMREKCLLALQCLHAPANSECFFNPISNEYAPLHSRSDIDETVLKTITQQSFLAPYTDQPTQIWLNPIFPMLTNGHVPNLIFAYRSGDFTNEYLETTNEGLSWIEGKHLQRDFPMFVHGGGCEYDWTLPALNSLSQQEYHARMKGGVPISLPSLGTKHIEIGFAIPNGYSLLNDCISQIECLNESVEHTISAALFGKGEFLESEDDEQLLINLEFCDFVRIYGLKFLSSSHSFSPRKVLLYANSTPLDFGSVEDQAPTQELTLEKEDYDRSKITLLRFVKFQNVKTLSIFIESNQGDEDVTRLGRVFLVGSAMTGTDITKLNEKK